MQGRQVDARTRQLVQAPCQVTMRGHVNPMEDAAAERRRATFNPDELAAFLHGGEDKLARRWARSWRRWQEPPRRQLLSAGTGHSQLLSCPAAAAPPAGRS